MGVGRSGDAVRRTRGADLCRCRGIRGFRVLAVRDLCIPPAVVVWQDRNSQNTETADRAETPRISRSGARLSIVR